MADLLMAPRSGRDAPVVRRGLGLAGSIGAILFFCLSLTPSLLPRHWLLQGVLSGITTAIGYGAGATVGALVRLAWPPLPPRPQWAWPALAGVGGPLVVVFIQLGGSWQAEVRQLVGAAPAAWWHPLPLAVTAAICFAVLLLAARAVRLATRRLADTLGRFSPRPVASVTAVALVAALSYGLGPAVAFPGFVDLAERAAAEANQAIAPDVARPTSRFVSGGPGSLVPWHTLGGYGREFTAGAVPRSELTAFSGTPAIPPVRVYVGRSSAESIEEQAALAVRELDRTGGFERSVVAVIVTTGTGWVNPAVADALEYLHNGDTAVVAMQYSYLPSWLSFVTDRTAATEAATALIGAVRDRLAAVPAGSQPELVVYGESLGSHGIESAFGDLDGLLTTFDGALLVGPPQTNPIWQQVTSERDPASPIWRPATYEPVRFAQEDADLAAGAADRPSVVYLQNASDPVVWWSPELLYRKPEWLDGNRGPDVSGAMHWFPVVTFWQVTVDLLRSTKAPPGHGHSYRESIADAWAALVPPAGWTDTDTARLRAQLP